MDWFLIGFGGVICAFLFLPGRIADVAAYRKALLAYVARYGLQALSGLLASLLESGAVRCAVFMECLEAAALIASAWYLLRAILGKNA